MFWMVLIGVAACVAAFRFQKPERWGARTGVDASPERLGAAAREPSPPVPVQEPAPRTAVEADPMAEERQAVAMAGPVIASRLPYLLAKAQQCTDGDGDRNENAWAAFVAKFMRQEIAPHLPHLDEDAPAWAHVWSAINDRVEEFQREQASEAMIVATPIIAQQVEVLARKFDQLSYKDEYGDWEYGDWERAVDDFIERKVAPKVPFMAKGGIAWSMVAEKVDEVVLAHEGESGDDTEDPIEYERLVAEELEAAGWDTHLTAASGDQGADVVAVRDGRRLVVQCKLYSKPVGNKAVQEVYAAKRHQSADFAVVVSNAGYTKAARQLASTTGVVLMHHEALPTINAALGIDET